MRRLKYGGFTLIELLVVVAIIAVLVALLLPSLAKAKRIGLRVVCASNQHHLHIGTMMFAQDHKELLFRHPNLPVTGTDGWDYNTPHVLRCRDPENISFMPYFSKQEEFFYCPANPVRPDTSYPWPGYGGGPAWGAPIGDGRYGCVVTMANLCNINPSDYLPQSERDRYSALVAHKITDDPQVGVWTDLDTWEVRDGYGGLHIWPNWYSGNHPGMYWWINPGVELDGRNLLRLDGSVTWDKFTDEMKTRFQLQGTTSGGWYISF